MSTTSSAQLHIHSDDELALDPAAHSFGVPSTADLTLGHTQPAALKQQVAERVAAHRARRAGPASPAPAGHEIGSTPIASGHTSIGELGTHRDPSSPSRTARVRSANIAAAVAERYAHSQSYRAFLASEAERAVHQAAAVAEVATINAHAIAVAQQQLLANLEHWETSDRPAAGDNLSNVPLSPVDYSALFDRESAPVAPRATTFSPRYPSDDPSATSDYTVPSFTVRRFEDAAYPAAAHTSALPEALRLTHTRFEHDSDDQLAEERLALDDEIAFRHDPVFEEASVPETIAANLIEFPRQLVAPRKARPRLAEGPLRDGDTNLTTRTQLRIFEVETDQLCELPASEAAPTEWSSILLSALPAAEFTGSADVDYLAVNLPQAAPMSLRLMSAVVDICLILTVQVVFTAVFTVALTHLLGEHAALEIPRSLATAGTAGTLAIFALLYQLLFFTLSDATPGMRYARIAFCTFSDENPTRSAMRRRILATLLAICPLGFGLLWAFLDEDSLGWHDRISRMYQRAY